MIKRTDVAKLSITFALGIAIFSISPATYADMSEAEARSYLRINGSISSTVGKAYKAGHCLVYKLCMNHIGDLKTELDKLESEGKLNTSEQKVYDILKSQLIPPGPCPKIQGNCTAITP